ncbi:hypothetical protein OG429_32295 [Streptomyces sp. NBC_00190]|uniref:DUF6879 family protein n=1 Tax=Streptomyces sp. NBC_00190 TaxID=2903634 RepID=UPI002E27E129|nr:DUF6879 family protein [Streptomyces sp. NBC_00190]
MRDGYMLDDPAFIDWKAGKKIDPHARWPQWFEWVERVRSRGVEVRRARIISEPVSEYVRFEHEITTDLNVAAGEQVRWLPRRQATDLALPGNDFWMFDGKIVQLNHFAGSGESIGHETVTDPRVIALCGSAFEAVWERAVPHEEYQLA